MASPEQVTAMAQQIKSIVKRDGWASDRSVAPSMQQILGKLTTLKVDVDLLKQTGIGAMVRKLTKHDDEIVRGYSTSLMNKWMTQVGVPPSKDKSSNSGSGNTNSYSSSYGNGRESTASTPAKGMLLIERCMAFASGRMDGDCLLVSRDLWMCRCRCPAV